VLLSVKEIFQRCVRGGWRCGPTLSFGGRLANFHALFTCLLAQHVHGYVMQEYSRACLIAFESLPKDADRSGWGRPGTSGRFRYQTPVVIMGISTPRNAACMHFALFARKKKQPNRDSMGWSLLPAFYARYRS
jgi:hypothetical protein